MLLLLRRRACVCVGVGVFGWLGWSGKGSFGLAFIALPYSLLLLSCAVRYDAGPHFTEGVIA